MDLRDALIRQAPSLALQREAQAEIARLDAALQDARQQIEHDKLVISLLRDLLQEARDDVLTELQRLREAAGRPQVDQRLAAQEYLLACINAECGIGGAQHEHR
jgi:hypothetical protein